MPDSYWTIRIKIVPKRGQQWQISLKSKINKAHRIWVSWITATVVPSACNLILSPLDRTKGLATKLVWNSPTQRHKEFNRSGLQRLVQAQQVLRRPHTLSITVCTVATSPTPRVRCEGDCHVTLRRGRVICLSGYYWVPVNSFTGVDSY